MVPEQGITFRGLFIIDSNFKVRQITINDLPVGRSVDEVLRLVQALQFTDEHGEVCPVNWTPGKDTIKPEVKDSKVFFGKQQTSNSSRSSQRSSTRSHRRVCL